MKLMSVDSSLIALHTSRIRTILTGFIIMYVRSMAIASELEVVLPYVEDGANAWTVAANAAMMNPTFMMTKLRVMTR